jgi:exonuclease VII small subunit
MEAVLGIIAAIIAIATAVIKSGSWLRRRLETRRSQHAAHKVEPQTQSDTSQSQAATASIEVLRPAPPPLEREAELRQVLAAALYEEGMLLKRQGLDLLAAPKFHRAGELGHAAALYEEGMLLKRQGLDLLAAPKFHRAGELGHAAALYEEGMLLKRQGLELLAEPKFRQAASTAAATL